MQLEGLKALQALDLSCVTLEAAEWDWQPLAGLARLSRLSLAGCSVDVLPPCVWGLPALRVSFRGCPAPA